MEAFDTNVLARLVVEDDPDQMQRAERVWRAAIAGPGAYLSTVVLVELAWVLRISYKFDRRALAATLQRLIDGENVFVENLESIQNALDLFERGKADFSDYVILAGASRAEATPLHTFDQNLAATDGALLVP